MPGVVEPAAPLFIDHNGELMDIENPAIDQPDGEVIQGEAMDVNEENAKKRAKQEEETKQAAEQE